MELLNEWMRVAIEDGDTETQRRLLALIRNETERTTIHQHWQEGDRDFIMRLVYPELENNAPAQLNGNGNGKHHG
jgi:hypothetical protein